jgi:hypothetical protein
VIVMRLLIVLTVVACAHPAPPPPPAHRRAGELMIEVEKRFERAGRAATSGHWELATYDVHELREVFDDELLPKSWNEKPPLLQESKGFVEHTLPALEAAARTHDAGWSTTFRETVDACNHCHHVEKMDFLVVGPTGALETR